MKIRAYAFLHFISMIVTYLCCFLIVSHCWHNIFESLELYVSDMVSVLFDNGSSLIVCWGSARSVGQKL